MYGVRPHVKKFVRFLSSNKKIAGIEINPQRTPIQDITYKEPILLMDELIWENFDAELDCFLKRVNLVKNNEYKTIFQDISFTNENNTKISVQGYYILKRVTTQLIALHYQNLLPLKLLEIFVKYLLEPNTLGKLSYDLGLEELSKISLHKSNEDKTIIARIDSNLPLCSTFYSLIYTINKVESPDKCSEFIDSFLIPLLHEIDLDSVPNQILAQILNELLANLKLSRFKLICNTGMNETLISKDRNYTVEVLVGNQVQARTTSSFVSSAFHSSITETLTSYLNCCYIDNVDYASV